MSASVLFSVSLIFLVSPALSYFLFCFPLMSLIQRGVKALLVPAQLIFDLVVSLNAKKLQHSTPILKMSGGDELGAAAWKSKRNQKENSAVAHLQELYLTGSHFMDSETSMRTFIHVPPASSVFLTTFKRFLVLFSLSVL